MKRKDILSQSVSINVFICTKIWNKAFVVSMFFLRAKLYQQNWIVQMFFYSLYT